MKSEEQQALELIDRLPEDVSTETILTELQFKALMLQRGVEAERGENVISHEEAKRRLSKWLDSRLHSS